MAYHAHAWGGTLLDAGGAAPGSSLAPSGSSPVAYEEEGFVVFDPTYCQATKDAGGQCKMRPVTEGDFSGVYCTAHRRKARKELHNKEV